MKNPVLLLILKSADCKELQSVRFFALLSEHLCQKSVFYVKKELRRGSKGVIIILNSFGKKRKKV